VKNAQNTPVVFSLKKSKKFIWIQLLIVSDIFPDNILYGGLPSIVNLIASVLFFSLDQQRPYYLTGHPLTIAKMTLCTNSGFPLKKSPPRCRVSEMIKPNKLGGQCPCQLQGISSDFHHPTYRLPFSCELAQYFADHQQNRGTLSLLQQV